MISLNVYIIAFYMLAFALGASIGSFLLVVVRRGIRGISWVKGRSVCESCGKELKWWELIPTVSYILLRGKCSVCKTKIDESHFICETYLGLIYVVGAYLFITGNKNGINIIIFMLAHTVLWITSIKDSIDQVVDVYPVYGLSIIAAVSTMDIKFIIIVIVLMFVSIFLISDNMSMLGAGDIDIFIAIFALTQSSLVTFDSIVNGSIIGLLLCGIEIIKTKKKPPSIAFIPLIYFGFVFASFGIGLLQWRL